MRPADEIVNGSMMSYLAPDDRSFLFGRGINRELPAGEAIMHQGDPTDHVLILLAGWVRVYSTTKDGGVVLLALRGPGDVLGDLAALQDWPRTANVETLQRVRFVQLRAERFISSLHDRPAIAVALLRQMSVRLREAEVARVDFATLDVAKRVAAHLMQLADDHGQHERDSVVIRTPLTQQDIADRIGASRRAVARALHTLRERGIVTTGRKLFVVAKPDVLRMFAADSETDYS
ncbi:MAG TPA: Crp/Fnr family transcriptional regulator [Actinophytocola sp.]|nr:Crp/Fnr family transcriptional regulator [Actinophytocola sp.]